ncbi:hypothetical protein [Maricaulis sp.]|uniref:hypothetical protein n=1 Tax=Maricaulis sp. TaxID=1486257 RepID=UPI003A93092A
MPTPKFDIIEASFYFLSVFKRRPGACLWVLVWSCVPLVLVIFAMMQTLRSVAIGEAGALPQAFVPVFIVCWIALMGAMLSGYAAWLRLMVRDEVAPGIPLRFGADEWRLLGSMFAIFGVYLLVALGMMIVVAPGSLLSRGFEVGTPAHMALNVLSVAIAFSLFIWFAVRAYPIYALSVLERRVVGPSVWAATKGVFWPVLACLLILASAFLLMQLALGMTLAPLGAALSMGIDPEAVRTGNGWAQLGLLKASLLTLISLVSFLLLLAMQAFALGPSAYIVLWNARRHAAAPPQQPDAAPPAP